MHRYLMHGLLLESALALPGVQPAPDNDTTPQVRIINGTVSTSLGAGTERGVFYEVATTAAQEAGDFLLTMPGIARYRVQRGELITIDAAAAADPDALALFLLGTPITVLLMQRRLLPLHAAAIATAQGAVLILGHASAGKSLLTAGLLARGYRLLADDVCAISGNPPQAMPQAPHLKLWQRGLKLAALSEASTQRVRPGLEKYYVHLPTHYCPDPQPLLAIYGIVPPHYEAIRVTQLRGLEKVMLLKRHTARQRILEQANLETWQMLEITRMAQQIPIARIQRPRRMISVDAMLDALIADWQSLS